jgi:hypothetical protein
MTILRRALGDRANRYESLGSFYRADSRRRSSREQDVGLWWRAGAHGPVYRAAWVQETGELYVTRLGPHVDGRGEVIVLGRARDHDQLEEVLEGWQDVCPQPDSMTWLRHRAAGLEVPESPSRSVAVPQARLRGGRVSRRRPDAPGPTPGTPVERPARAGLRSNAGAPRPSTS